MPAQTSAQVPAPAIAAAPAPVVEPAIASLATLREIEAQRNPKRRVDVTLNRMRLRINQDALQLKVQSSQEGYVYLALLGSDRKSFYLLFPNGRDKDNTIRANVPMHLPRPDWQLIARGPAGTDHLLVVVTDTPRDLTALALAAPTGADIFTFTLNDLPGRAALFDFFTGRGVTGSSEAFGARLVSVQEVP